MSTRAVTPDAPAASPMDSERSNFLPSDYRYRLTGEMPAVTEDSSAESQAQQDAVTERPPAGQESDTSAASEAASTQRKGPAQSKSPQTSRNRWQEITSENKQLRQQMAELRERLARQEGREEVRSGEAREPGQETRTATDQKRSEPKFTDKNADGTAKYANYQQFLDDLRKWDREEGVRLAVEEMGKRSEQQRVVEQERVIGQELNKRFDAGRGKYADFDRVALNPELLIPKGSVTDIFLLDSDHTADVLYHLGQHPELLNEFYGDYDAKTGRFVNRLSPQRQFRKLMEIEAQFSGKKTEPQTEEPPAAQVRTAKPVSQAPQPPHQTSGKGAVQKDAVAQAVDDGDMATYMREMNARQLARLKRK